MATVGIFSIRLGRLLLACERDTAAGYVLASQSFKTPMSIDVAAALGNSLFARAAIEAKPIEPVAMPAAAAKCAETAKLQPVSRTEMPTNETRGRAFLFRGVAGLIYSTGLDKLAERINRAGLTSSVNTYMVWSGVAADAIREYRRSPFPIILIGHSLGGDSAVAFAEILNNADIPVSLLVTYDPTRIADAVTRATSVKGATSTSTGLRDELNPLNCSKRPIGGWLGASG